MPRFIMMKGSMAETTVEIIIFFVSSILVLVLRFLSGLL